MADDVSHATADDRDLGERTNDNTRAAKDSTTGQALARFGLASRAIVYFSLAGLVIALAFGNGRRDTDQGSALKVLGESAAGTAVLVALAVGVVSYTLWRWSVALLGPDGRKADRRGRLQAFVEGAAYLPLGYTAVAVAVGNNKAADQGEKYRTLSGRVMQDVAGQVLVGAVGAVVIGVGLFLASQGLRRSFADELDDSRMSATARRVTLALGVVGSIGRGVIFTLAGVLVVYAAATASPDRAGGVDSALSTLAGQGYGRLLLLVAAVCFASFALFALAEAVYRRT